MMDAIGFGATNLDEIYVVPSFSALSGFGLMPGSEKAIDRRQYDKLTRRLRETGAARRDCGGGQAANTVYALARLGFRTALISSAGADAEGDGLLEGLAPVDVSAVARGGRTARCVIILERAGERTIRVLPAVGPPRLGPVAAWRSLGGARCLHLTSLARTEDLARQVNLVESVAGDVKVSFDPGELYCRLGREALAPILDRVDVLFLNEREAELLTGRPAFLGCPDLLRRDGAVLVGKKGPRGVEVIGRGERFAVPARAVAAVDSTGAGDVFAAGFLAGLLLGLELEKCALLGSEAAAHSVTGYGRAGYPGRELLESMGMPTPASQRARGGAS